MKSVSEILDTMEEMVEGAWNLPLTGGKCAVSTDELLNMIGDLRAALPAELKQAKRIVVDRKDIVADAKKEAAGIVADAEKRARALVAEHEITRQAQEQANRMLAQAHSQSNDLRRMTNEYVEKLLTASENALVKNTQEIKSAHAEIRRLARQK